MRLTAFIFLPVILIALLYSCGGERKPIVLEEDFAPDTILIDDAYPEIDGFVKTIMAELKVCTLEDSVLTLPPCNNEFFRVFKFKPDKEWKAGFIIEMIPGLFKTPVHQVVVVDEYFGKYDVVNQYLGMLLEMRTTEDGYNDLLIGYSDPDIGLVAIRHEWQKNKYEPVDVEEINNHYIKPEYKDSINDIFLSAFDAGY